MTHVVIMDGGMGSRFWPLSTPEFPKQFIDILGCGRTLIQLTVDRFQDICPLENYWVVTNEKLQKDANNNAAVGNAHLFECGNCVVHTEDARKVVLQGLNCYIISEKNGQFLFCKRSDEQRIKEFSGE